MSNDGTYPIRRAGQQPWHAEEQDAVVPTEQSDARVMTDRSVELIGQMHPIDTRGAQVPLHLGDHGPEAWGIPSFERDALGPRQPHPKPRQGNSDKSQKRKPDVEQNL
jgi:hypothetical protein